MKFIKDAWYRVTLAPYATIDPQRNEEEVTTGHLVRVDQYSIALRLGGWVEYIPLPLIRKVERLQYNGQREIEVVESWERGNN
jgi:hypothetical protein